MSPLKGQKIKDNPKDFMLRTRLDDETLKQLDVLVEVNNTNRSDCIRRLISYAYAMEKKENEKK